MLSRSRSVPAARSASRAAAALRSWKSRQARMSPLWAADLQAASSQATAARLHLTSRTTTPLRMPSPAPFRMPMQARSATSMSSSTPRTTRSMRTPASAPAASRCSPCALQETTAWLRAMTTSAMRLAKHSSAIRSASSAAPSAASRCTRRAPGPRLRWI